MISEPPPFYEADIVTESVHIVDQDVCSCPKVSQEKSILMNMKSKNCWDKAHSER